jgi:hypothetical protein
MASAAESAINELEPGAGNYSMRQSFSLSFLRELF